jgi:hypothetical protein
MSSFCTYGSSFPLEEVPALYTTPSICPYPSALAKSVICSNSCSVMRTYRAVRVKATANTTTITNSTTTTTIKGEGRRYILLSESLELKEHVTVPSWV